MKRFFRFITTLFITGCAILIGCNIWVIMQSRGVIKDDLDQLTNAQVALVLGTSKSTRKGEENLFFKDRIRAAADLYHAKKVKKIMVSGDNRTRYYNEPEDMRRALINAGVPSNDIILDYAGLSTFDSVIRANQIFEEDNIIIVTQRFHAYRATFIARENNLNVQAYAADFQSEKYPAILFREFLARIAVIRDLYLVGRKPDLRKSEESK